MDLRYWHRLGRARILPPAALLLLLAVPHPSSAMERIKISTTTSDAASGSLSPSASGSIVRAATATTTWYLYPGACIDRANGTWTPRSTPVADSLNGYSEGTSGPYGIEDQTAQEILWHVSDNFSCTPGTTCPPALVGDRMIWCGKFDPVWIVKYGYPSFTYQILYIDTGPHAGISYDLTFTYQLSVELNYDHVWLVGGANAGAADPYGNSRTALDNVIASGGYLVQWTGTILAGTPGASGGSTILGPIDVTGTSGANPTTVSGATYTIDAQNRALYLVVASDCFNASEDGLWPDGHGVMLDDILTSDNGRIYTDDFAAGGVDGFGGNVILGTPGAPVISARVAGPAGAPWRLTPATSLPTPDFCSPKFLGSDLIFATGDASFHPLPGDASSIRTCTFPIPPGVASVVAQWNEYLDLPAYSGFVQFAEYRTSRSGTWSAWKNTDPGGTRRVDGLQAWGTARSELAEAVGADSVQLRYSLRCVPELGSDQHSCQGLSTFGLLYDDFRLEVVTGVQPPVFGIYPSALAQTTFVDGTIQGSGCSPGTYAAGQCWPGVRGSDVGNPAAIHDNVNGPLGDSLVVAIVTGGRPNGKGVNWHRGFDKSLGGGLTIAYTNPNFVPTFDGPRVIYRLFDPATKNWSPFDSSELDADAVAISAGDTVLINSRFRMNWPPRDKLSSTLPGGFSVNGKALYSQLNFLPRGTRLQYYFKGVDLVGGTTYQFSSDSRAYEVMDLPTLPGSSIVAPDIIEFDVLPGVYSTAGTAGTLVAGKTNTPLLNVDDAYTAWSYGVDPVTQALRALGVRADRYRMLQGTEQGGNIGGHEFAGQRQGRLANYFPNMEEYGIADSLAAWYRIMIVSTHRRGTYSAIEEQDARLLQFWWQRDTGTNGGDRGILLTGNDAFNSLAAVGSVPHPNENFLATNLFGVGTASTAWNGNSVNHAPLIRDMFADPAAGPGLGAAGAYTYPVDGTCPGPDWFDALFSSSAPGVANAALYPTFSSVTNAAAVANIAERDITPDHDRNKALGYGFSIQFIRQGTSNLVDTRAQVLYKFLTSCRGPRGVADTAACWPCPTDPNKYANWALLPGFQTATYGPLYPIQNANLITAVSDGIPAPSFADALMQNRPNPFNPETVIPFSLGTSGRVTVRIYDVRGRLVRTVMDAVKPAGIHAARWNGTTDQGSRSASGIYFYVITYPDGHTSSRKMTVLR